MTVNERIETQSFAYDEQFPPDVAEGLPLSSACHRRETQHAPLKRALHSCKLALSRKR
jgi:hypothetical protein